MVMGGMVALLANFGKLVGRVAHVSRRDRRALESRRFFIRTSLMALQGKHHSICSPELVSTATLMSRPCHIVVCHRALVQRLRPDAECDDAPGPEPLVSEERTDRRGQARTQRRSSAP